MTEQIYLQDTYLYNTKAILTSIEISSKGPYFTFDRTIFYPRGGGQPSDKGVARIPHNSAYLECEITQVFMDTSTGIIQHFFRIENTIDIPGIIGTEVELSINEKVRNMNANCHTAGHLLDAIVHLNFPELSGKIGAHDPNEPCYVKFQGQLSSAPPQQLIDITNEQIAVAISSGNKIHSEVIDESSSSPETLTEGGVVSQSRGRPYRLVTIEGFPPSPCGGTHIDSLRKLRNVIVTKVKFEKKENITKINYTCE